MRLTEAEMAECLSLPAGTIRRWIRQGRIPIHKKGGKYLFEPGVLQRWTETNRLPFRLPENETGIEAQNTESPEETPIGTLSAAMQRGGVIYDIAGEDTESLFDKAVGKITGVPDDLKPDILERLIQRERLSSTGIGKGVAIPHPRNPSVDVLEHPLIATCFPEKEVDFKSVDNNPVFIMFFLLCPTPRHHLHLLSRLSFCLRDDRFVDFLKTRPVPEVLFARIAEIEAALEHKEGF
ncbi:MAG: PTS sugar transporter subunit IIA [Thermodesulfobacteriota bacterium]